MPSPATHPLAAVLAAVARLISGVQVRWVDAPLEARQRVYFANHTSHLDAVVLWAALPGDVRAQAAPVAGRDYWEKSAMRRYLAKNVFNALLINRNPTGAERTRANAVQTIGQLVEALGQGRSLIVFPEGTRGTVEAVAPFKSGLYHIARERPDVQFVPAYLENLNRILPKGEVLPVPMLSAAIFGAPITIEPDEEKAAFLTRAREAVCRLKPS
jgi:1-acyl-sn-glycerol-3-phosphate acyltransferase